MSRHRLLETYRRIESVFAGLVRFAARPWYPVLVAALAGLDLFILLIPTDLLLISAVLAKPRRWLLSAFAVSLGSALGAGALAACLGLDGGFLVRAFPALFHTSGWSGTETFLRSHGHWAIGVIAASPLPHPPAVLLSALSGVSPATIFVATFVGRGAKYLVMAFLATRAPRFFRKTRDGGQAHRFAVPPS